LGSKTGAIAQSAHFSADHENCLYLCVGGAENVVTRPILWVPHLPTARGNLVPEAGGVPIFLPRIETVPNMNCRRMWLAGLCGVLSLLPCANTARAGGLRKPDPATILPLPQIPPQHRESVAEVIRENTFHRQGAPETFPCHPKIYLHLLNEPAVTLALWQDLSSTPARLRQIGPNRYEGTDGAGTTATWEFVLRSPRLHVLLCDLQYTSPRGNARLEGRIVLIVRSGFYKEVNGDPWVQHDVEAFVKVDSRGWKAMAVPVRPLIEKLLQDQVQEAGWFVSLMGRLVQIYPDWAAQTAGRETHIPAETIRNFQGIVVQTRKAGAFTGRPTLADSGAETVRK
jgi:hypothetical protein